MKNLKEVQINFDNKIPQQFLFFYGFVLTDIRDNNFNSVNQQQNEL